MLISHDHRFIFLKTTKTAGTSIEIALSRFMNHPRDVITPLIPADEALRREAGGQGPRNHQVPWPACWRPKAVAYRLRTGRRPPRFWNHCPGVWVRREVDRRTWDDYFKFAFVRNPWDKVVSHYWMDKARERIPPDLPFPAYVRDVVVPDAPKRLNWPIIAEGDRLLVDHVARFEDLLPEMRGICDRVGVAFDGTLPRAKGGFRTDKRHYSQLYDEETKERVRTLFAKEIEVFGYSFEAQPAP